MSGESDDDSVAKYKKAAAKAHNADDEDDDFSLDSEDYILGTLIVRVVAARDLELPRSRKSSGLRMFDSSVSATGIGAGNPYASVEFRNTRQRTSVVYRSSDPIWPRSETMYMDVSLPKSKLTYGNMAMDSKDDLQTVAVAAQEEQAPYEPPNATITVALFHMPESAMTASNNNALYPDKKSKPADGDSDDLFLGMADFDLTPLLTGKCDTIDEWLPIEGQNLGSCVRLICEYEPADEPLRCGDLCRLTTFCRPTDVFPVPTWQQFVVVAVDRRANTVTLSYRTLAEEWECTFVVHRYMVVCDERYFDTMSVYKQELQSISDRLSGSLMVKEIADTAERVAVDGLVNIGEDIVRGGMSLFQRWMSGGIDTAISDVAHATNWDGQHYYGSVSLDVEEDEENEEVIRNNNGSNESNATEEHKDVDEHDDSDTTAQIDPLPNMPPCPITGEPMINPVVAADGHTYERTAIARWLKTSDKSPMTGGVLAHKELVPNYVLLSSLQEAAAAAAASKQEG